MKTAVITMVLLALASKLMSQSISDFEKDSTKQKNPFTWGIFADVYYSYDFNKPLDHLRPAFLYNHNRHNEFNLNLGLIKASYTLDRVRANFGLMAGTYAQYNLAAEPELLRNVFEANAGVKISGRTNLWIDAGIMPSHLGYESAISKDNWTLTRGMAAENSPYYETGVKITYTTKNEKLIMSGFVLNGWQRIQRPVGNNTPAFGTQLTVKPNAKLTLNWSSFIGNDKPDSAKQWRYFNNFYGIIQFNDKVGLIVAFDIGQEQKTKGSNTLNTWYTPSIVVRYTPGNKWAFAARGEYYSDEKGVIIFTGTPNGFKTFGASLNVDRKINETFLWRTSIRTFSSEDAIFSKNNEFIKTNTAITSSFAISF